MPNLTFVLPHWMYWSGLIIFPLIAMYMLRNQSSESRPDHSVSPAIGYFLLITAGFVGMHRLYLRNLLGLLYIPLFITLLYANAAHRDIRVDISNARTAIVKAEFLIKREEKNIAKGKTGAVVKLELQKQNLLGGQEKRKAAESSQKFWADTVAVVALLILAGLMFDAYRLPKILHRCRALDESNPVHTSTVDCATITADGGEVLEESIGFNRFVGKLNQFSGTFVAYWSAIAVIVYYYEVISRYVFNSPTNWAHESMFLMFGAQYLIAGGFCLRENAHVRVDVFYTHFSRRTKAMVDIATSVFFFIFIGALLMSGWIFFMDSYQVREVSFTEWGIQYYPIKFCIALGALLLLLQGIARLLSDVSTLRESY
ncbi:MAG: TRAP transporter small permease subunit [Gammaproteobacteria bacterium]|nr:TRAP transporter small permease subunit [Gammaproteobacteria bacterium]